MKVKKVRFETVQGVFRDLNNQIKAGLAKGLKQLGEKAVTELKGHIDKQDLNWKPLNPEYRSQKIREGYSDKILIRTGKLKDSQIFIVQGSRSVEIGVLDNDLGVIAQVHEFGSAVVNIPARPLYRPTGEQLVEWLKSNNILEMAVLNQIKSRYAI